MPEISADQGTSSHKPRHPSPPASKSEINEKTTTFFHLYEIVARQYHQHDTRCGGIHARIIGEHRDARNEFEVARRISGPARCPDLSFLNSSWSRVSAGALGDR